MPECVWMQGEICMNADCPMRAGCCPVENEQEICGWYEPEEAKEKRNV